MSKYPEWWDQTITIYNKYENPSTRSVSWYRTVLTKCFWKYTGNQVTVGDTTIETDTTICRIPKNKKFMEKYLWDALPDEQKSKYFTLGTGDILIKGNVSDDVNEYVVNKRSSDLLIKYRKLQGCMLVERFSINIGSSRCNEHYYVRGV